MSGTTANGRGSFKAAWAELLANRRLRIEFLLTVLCFVITVKELSTFLEYVEARPGVHVPDPVLELFPAVDVTWYTFVLIYSGLMIALVYFSRQPRRLVTGMQTYVILALFRMGAMFFLALEPPTTMIALKDPFVEYFVGTDAVLTKDLFFSGHTSTMFLLALFSTDRRLRIFLLIATVLVAACVLIQHVHYTVDVLAAPFFAYGAYRVAILTRSMFITSSHTSQRGLHGMDR
ncbi:MAG: phosphatase PAP2-related protein [Bacteroidota bacterium]